MMTISLYPISKDERNRLIILLLFIFFSAQGFSQGLLTGNMKVTFTDIRSDIGILAIGVYSAEDQWIYEPEFNFHFTKEHLKNGELTVELKDIPYGTYSISVLDDENRNDEMEYFIGLPREGWGMSANPSFLKLKAPSWESCNIELDVPEIEFNIKLNYVRKNKEIKEEVD